jgi:glyoxylate reductase
MTKQRVLVTHPLVGDWLKILESVADVTVMEPNDLNKSESLKRAVEDVDGLICLLTDKIDAAVIRSGKKLKVIGNYAVGVDNIDLQATKAAEITVCHTPNVLTEATAELAFGLLISVSRRLVEADRFVRSGAFTGWKPDLLLGTALGGKQMGILGFGRIGKAVADRSAAFGMKVVYWGRQSKQNPELGDARRLQLDPLLSTSDFISVHLPLTRETRHLLDRNRLNSMKKGAILINTARGAIVDESALVACLQNGNLAGAGLDVYEDEPVVHPALLSMSNVVLAPHIGSATAQTRALMAEHVCRDVVRVLIGESPCNGVRTG